MKNFIFYFLLILSQFISNNAHCQDFDIESFEKLNIRNIGPGTMSGRITAIDANLSYNNEVIVGTASGGAWLSTDGGLTWKTIFDDTDCQAVGSIKINPKNPDEIWIGTGEGNPRNSQNSGKGIYRSIDGAKTWKKMGLENTKVIHRILINHQNDKIVYAAALGSAWGPNSERGVFRSKDGGTTWEKSLYVNDSTGCAELVMDPKNPNKLIAAMWQYERKPWTFTSGGKGSGIYITYDGGDSWKKIGEKNGLPAGDLGRIGLAIAPSNPLIVYAIVEAEKNAFYISEDGGENWRKTGENNIGNRPFYYHEIYVDPKEEKSIYSIHTTITKSYDGGKNFENFVDWNIHPDHHAFWIDPNDPNHIINGNDGGLNITYDMGKSWKYVENIPVGQFYHVNYDYEIPFNVYGGLQDNGSWVGPSSVWADGSIQNFHWKELLFGDGFDVMPDASDSRYGYAMSQGGSLNYYDKITGTTRFIRPIHPQNVILRCNWNAAIAQSPFKKECVYFGSQFLHKSCDKGHSWEIISPDLSTNDTLKQQQAKSGGLTPDATAAENHCTILCIAPSNHNEDIIWVGTDDGNLQLTTDGGKTWVNQNNKLPNFPKNGWIPQIEVSKVDANEVFVVVNDYRQNNWEPYLYHTSNNGKSWSRIVGSKDVEGHCLSIVQDSIASNLLFLGTDFGLYFSIDKGKHWQKFTKKFPSVSVTDIKIHPQTSDLILATFGRGIWIVDNINPLRELALSSFTPNKTVFKFFQPTDAYIAFYASNSGPHFPGDAIYSAPNKPTAAMIPTWLNEKQDTSKKESAKDDSDKENYKILISIISESKDTVRRFEVKPDSNLFWLTWRLESDGVIYPNENRTSKPTSKPAGLTVLPGKYKIIGTYKKYSDSVYVNVNYDPRLVADIKGLNQRIDFAKKFYNTVALADTTLERMKELKKNIQLVENQLNFMISDTTKNEMIKMGKTLKDSIEQLTKLYNLSFSKGMNHFTKELNDKLYEIFIYISSNEAAPDANVQIAYENVKREVDDIVSRVNALQLKEWKAYTDRVKQTQPNIFKEYPPIK